MPSPSSVVDTPLAILILCLCDFLCIFPFAVVSPSDSDSSHSPVSTPIQPHTLHTPHGLIAAHSMATDSGTSLKQSSDWTLMKLVRTATVPACMLLLHSTLQMVTQCLPLQYSLSTVYSRFHSNPSVRRDSKVYAVTRCQATLSTCVNMCQQKAIIILILFISVTYTCIHVHVAHSL